MSYEKYDWRTGEIITEVRLDHMEDGIYDASTGLETKAEIDGAYESMTVGNAEQLVSTQYVEDSEPYVFRASGGSADIGNREEDTIVGGSIAWNQIVRNGDYSASGGTATTTDGVCTFTASASGQQAYLNFTQTVNHVYLASIMYKTATASADVKMRVFDTDVNGTASTSWQTSNILTKSLSSSGVSIGVVDRRESGFDAIEIKNAMAYDLTQMFGSAVADAVYAMEQANAGSGVAWFKAQYPLDYYEYNTGELKSVEGLTSHDMVGFNQWDEEWEVGGLQWSNGAETSSSTSRRSDFIRVLPNTAYYFKGGSIGIGLCWYDASKNFIESIYANVVGRTITSPSNAGYVRITSSNADVVKDNVCINLSWSGTRNGEYESYVKHSYPLDSTLTLRGIPKVDANGQMYYDGDTYTADGTVERRYGIVDLGTLGWAYNSNDAYFQVRLTNGASPADGGRSTAICSKYTTFYGGTTVAFKATDKTIYFSAYNVSSNCYICVRDTAYTDATAFKTAMSGVMLVYELATPTTEQAEPFTTPQIVEDWGTEKYVTTGIPVGHETKYLSNLRDKLQHLPDIADSDGAYLIQQTGTQMALVNFRIPKAENLADGTYVLKATVSGGTPTYTWEAE